MPTSRAAAARLRLGGALRRGAVAAVAGAPLLRLLAGGALPWRGSGRGAATGPAAALLPRTSGGTAARWTHARRPTPAAASAPSLTARRSRGGAPLEEPLDQETIKLHKAYHDRTVDFTVENFEWVNSKGYQTDGDLASNAEEQAKVWRSSKERLACWPRLERCHLHEVSFGDVAPQRFCGGDEAASVALGDPGDNVFVINLPRRPAKLRNVLHQLHSAGLAATVVDAVDGDVISSQEEIARLGASTLPGYCGHKNTLPHLTTGQLGCFMSHFAVWRHMVEKGIHSALILEDDFDLQEDFARRLGEALEEARHENWNLMYLGRSPTEPDLRRVSPHVTEPGYTLWTVGYILRLEAARALVEARVEQRLAPLDHYFSVAMGRGFDGRWNEKAVEWSQHVPQVLRGLAITPPLVMPYVGSMFLSDTAMVRKGTKFVVDLPATDAHAAAAQDRGHEAAWRASRE